MSLYHLVHHTRVVLPFVLKVPTTKEFLHLVVSGQNLLSNKAGQVCILGHEGHHVCG